MMNEACTVHGRESHGAERSAGNALLRSLLRRWRAVLATFLVLAVCGALSAFLAPQQWKATAIVSFTPRPQTGISPDTVALVAQGYAVKVTSDAATETVAQDITGIDPGALAGGISTELEAGTGNLRIVVALSNRVQAVESANAAARAMVRQVFSDDLVTADLSAAATTRAAVLTPSRALLLTAALVAAAVIAMVFGVVLDRWRGPRPSGLTRTGAVPAVLARQPETSSH